MNNILLVLIAGCALIVLSSSAPEDYSIDKALAKDDIQAYHFHTYIILGNKKKEKEAMDFRKATRAKINDGTLRQCSLNQVYTKKFGPHILAQYELCCNKSSMVQALSWNMQNHGKLSVLIHPLTVYEHADHMSRATWLGSRMPLDVDCGCLPCESPTPIKCPVYPKYPDEMPKSLGEQSDQFETFSNISGIENYNIDEQVDSERLTYTNCAVV